MLEKSVTILHVVVGFGHLLAGHLDQLGMTVFAGCLNASGEGAQKLKASGSSRLHVLQMDVTSDEQVAQCVAYIESTVGKSSGWCQLKLYW